MFLIKTETRELKIDNGNGEKYFDAVLKMMLDERKPTNMGFPVGMEPGATVKVPLVSTLNPGKTEENEGGVQRVPASGMQQMWQNQNILCER